MGRRVKWCGALARDRAWRLAWGRVVSPAAHSQLQSIEIWSAHPLFSIVCTITCISSSICNPIDSRRLAECVAPLSPCVFSRLHFDIQNPSLFLHLIVLHCKFLLCEFQIMFRRTCSERKSPGCQLRGRTTLLTFG